MSSNYSLISFQQNRNTTMDTNAHGCFRSACDNVTLVHKLVFLCKKTTYFSNNESILGQLFRSHCLVLFAIIHAKKTKQVLYIRSFVEKMLLCLEFIFYPLKYILMRKNENSS